MSDIGPVIPPSVPPPTAQPAANTAPAASAPQQPVPQQPVPPQSGNQAGGQPQPNPQPPPATPPAADPAAQISAALRELAQGGQITATVVARDQATLLVRTAAGATLALNNLATALEQANVAVLNAALKLQLNPASPNQATITSVNGASLQPPLQAMAQPPTAAQMALAASPPQPSAPSAPVTLPQPGQTLPATVTAPPAPAATPATSRMPAPALPTGSQLQLVVKAVTLPAPTVVAPPVQANAPAAATPPASPPATPAPVTSAPVAPLVGQNSQAPAAPAATAPPVAASATPAATPSQAPAAPSALPSAAVPAENRTLPPSPLIARAPQPVIPPAGTTAPQVPAAQAVPTQITGVVSGQGQAGQVLVSTPQGVLSLSLPQPLPPGTQIAFELSALVRPPGTPAAQVGPAPLAGVLTRLQGEWPVLQQTLDAVRAADPALAQRLQAELLPQPNARLASTALQFMAAAAIGSAQAWLGAEAARKLEQAGKGDLLRKLDEDFRELGRLNQRQGDNEWQALVMPMLVGGRVEPIQIFMRRRRDPKRQQQQTRFIIDFDLESTGPIQFDGFVGPKQLDLILRSESEFGPAFRLDVTQIFTNALEITGMTGSIRFHDREKPLAWPSPELEAVGPSTEVKA